MLKLTNISFGYLTGISEKRIPVLSNINIDFRFGEISVLVGPSGCGKTTLLNLMAGLLTPVDGVIAYPNNENKPSHVGYVFQTPSLIPWRTIRENALFGAEVMGNRNSEVEQRCEQLFRTYGLSGYENSYPSSLSGGMQQRVSIIRAVLSGSKIILLDEPFSNSDFIMKRELQLELSRLVSEENLIAVLVTHDIEEAIRIGDRVAVLAQRPTYVKAQVEIDIPREERLRGGAAVMNEVIAYVEKIEQIFRLDETGLAATRIG